MSTEDFDGVVAHRKELGLEFYKEQYREAEKIEIVGIACQSFARYLNPDLDPTLFERLKEGLKVYVYLVNPYSDFVETRTKEENNKNLRRDIFAVIDSIRRLCDKLRVHGERRIEGVLSIKLIDKNPYFSIFRGTREEHFKSTMCLGLLLQGNKGTDSPMLQSWNTGKGAHVWDSITDHLSNLNQASQTLMLWHGDNVNFEYSKPPWFDTFLCYNSKDQDAVVAIGRDLRKRGCVPWLDEWELSPGAPFTEELDNIIKVSSCATIFFGRHGISKYQGLEVSLIVKLFLEKGLKIIVVILKDVEGNPDLPFFLSTFQHVDFRKSSPDPLDELIRAITTAKRQ
jgi:hypothetical protein